MDAPITRVGLIGLGIMGQPMASNLIKGGLDVTVFSRTRAKVDALVAQGAHAGSSAADVAARCEMVVVIVTDSGDVEQVAESADGVFAGARSGLVVADMSTISPAVTRRLAGASPARSCRPCSRPAPSTLPATGCTSSRPRRGVSMSQPR